MSPAIGSNGPQPYGGGSTGGRQPDPQALTVKGSPITQTQIGCARGLLAVAKTVSAPGIAQQAIIFAAIMESTLGVYLGWNPSNPTYGGPLAGNIQYFGQLGSPGSNTVLKAQANSFFKGTQGFQGAGGAIAGAGQYSDPALLGVTVEGPFDAYDPPPWGQYIKQGGMPLINLARAEAVAIVKAYGSGNLPGGIYGLGGTGTPGNQAAASLWQVGSPSNPHQDYWTTINQYAMDAQWFCLALDTPIPTPSGWTTMGELRVGDHVFGSDGMPTRVTRVTPTYANRECFEVAFKDGTSIIADADHRWETSSLYKDPGATRAAVGRDRWVGLRSTRQLAGSVTRNGYTAYNHHIRIAPALVFAEAPLPIDPYVFGYWLGDGSKTDSRITIGQEDVGEVIGELARIGMPIRNTCRHSDTTCLDLYLGERGDFVGDLRALGVFGNKHIPDLYKRSAPAQRVALLQGLMDSDGCVTQRPHRCIFANTNSQLARDVLELTRGLGLRSFFNTRPGGWEVRFPRGHVSIASDCHTVAFTASPNIEPFRLDRKLQRYRDYLAGLKIAQHSQHHTIVSVERVESVPVRCIDVAAPDHLFLAGESLVPTHNCFSDGETLFVADGIELMAQQPAAVINRFDPAVIDATVVYDNTAFQFASTHRRKGRTQRRSSLAKVTSPTEVTIRILCDIDQFRAGDVVLLRSFGVASGIWLIGDTLRSIFSPFTDLTLVQAMQPINAATGLPTGPAYLSGTAAGAPGSGTVIAAMVSEAASVNNANYPYVWGGGHAAAGTASIGRSGGPGFDGHTVGFDCSGAVGAVLAAGGLLTWAASVPGSTGIVDQLLSAKKASPGTGTGTPACTLYDSPQHIFMSLNNSGRTEFFGTSDGAGNLPPTANKGAGWIPNGSVGSGYRVTHIPQSILGQKAGG